MLEGDETLTVTLTHASTMAGTVRLGTPTTATTTIGDGDGTVTVDVAAVDSPPANDNATVTEGDAQTFTVTLSGPVSMDVVVGYVTANGTATTADYSRSASGTVTIPALETMGTITVPTLEDTLAEDAETFILTLSEEGLPANVKPRQATAEATIKDDDPLAVSVVGPENVAEGENAVYTVLLKGGTSIADVVVPYEVTRDVATIRSETLTISRGRTTGTIVVPTDGESGNTLVVTLSDPNPDTTTGEVKLEPPSEQRTVVLDEGKVTVSVAASGTTVSEGDAARFTLTLSESASAAVTVMYTTMVTMVTSGPSSATIPFNSRSVTFTVDTPEDTQAEDDETLTVTLQPTGLVDVDVSLGTDTAEVTIRDDDPLAVSVRSLEQTVVEGGTGSRDPDPTADATFEVKLHGGIGSDAVTVMYALSGTATGGADQDYEAPTPSGTVTIKAGDPTATITITTLPDEVLEGDETLTVTLTHASTMAGTVRLGTPTTATTTIGDGDGTVTVEVEAVDALQGDTATVNEGDAQTFTVTLSGKVSKDVTVALAMMDGTATGGADYMVPEEDVTLVIAAGKTAGTIMVETLRDTLEESNETFTVTATLSDPPASVRIREATATASIKDANMLTAQIVGPQNVAEGNPATFTVKLGGGTGSEAVILDYMVDGDATKGNDYEAPSGTLTIPRGAATGNIVIRTIADDEVEDDETLTVTLDGEANGARTSAGMVTVDMDNNTHSMEIKPPGTVVLSVSDVTIIEGDPAIFTVTMSEAVAEAVTVKFATMADTATAGEDYTADDANFVILAGQTMATFTVDTVEDTKAEDTETFTVMLTLDDPPTNLVLGTGEATATITDDTLSVSVEGPGTVTEGGTVEFTVTLTGAIGDEAVVVTYTVTGRATSGEDYTPPSETLTIPSGATTGPS